MADRDVIQALRAIKALALQHHGDEPPATLLHALLVEIPAECDSAIAALDAAGARPTPPAPDAVERERDYDAMLDWLDERVGDGRGEVRLGLTDNGGVGCWLPGDETVPEGESVEEAIRFRMERSAEAEAARDGKGG